MKAIIVARVSTGEQKEAGNSLPAQEHRLREYCARKHFDIIEAYSFDESAYGDKRDEFDQILEGISKLKEKTAVCFDKVDRLSRNVFDKRVAKLYELALDGHIELHFSSDNSTIHKDIGAAEKFKFTLDLGLAKYYSDAIGDSVRRAFEKKRMNGEWTGAAPIGYMNVPGADGRRDIATDPTRVDFIRQTFELYATGRHSIATLWDEMTRRGLRGKGGRPLARSNLDSMLRDTFYFGLAYSRKYNLRYPHKYPQIISRELFDRCRLARAGRAATRSKEASGYDFLFKGLIRCARCNCLLSPQVQKGHVYYSCTNAKGTCRSRRYVREEDLLRPVKAVFADFERITPTTQEGIVSRLKVASEAEFGYSQRRLATLRTEYDRNQLTLKRCLDLLLDGSITREERDEKVREMSDRQDQIRVEMDEVAKGDKSFHIHVGTVLSLAQRAGQIFEDSEPAEKRSILKMLLQNPTVSEKNLSFSLAEPFDTVRELANQPNWLPSLDKFRNPEWRVFADSLSQLASFSGLVRPLV